MGGRPVAGYLQDVEELNSRPPPPPLDNKRTQDLKLLKTSQEYSPSRNLLYRYWALRERNIHCIPGWLTVKQSSEILKAIRKRYLYDCFMDVSVLSYKPFLSHFLPAYYPSQKVLECLWSSVHFMFKPTNQLERLKSMREAIVNAIVALGCVPSNSYASLVLSKLSTNSYL